MEVLKDKYVERAVPIIWRADLERIANAFVSKTFPKLKAGLKIDGFDEACLKINYENIDDYTDEIGLLHETSWLTSIYLWQGSYWAVLADLSNVDSETTDLVLHVDVREREGSFVFTPGLIYVP